MFWLPKTLKDAAGLTNSQTWDCWRRCPTSLAIFTTMLIVSVLVGPAADAEDLHLAGDADWRRRVFDRGGDEPYAFLGCVRGVLVRRGVGVYALRAALGICGGFGAAGMCWGNPWRSIQYAAGRVGGFVGSYAVGFLNGYFHNDWAGFLFLAGSMVMAGLVAALVRAPSVSDAAAFPVIPIERRALDAG